MLRPKRLLDFMLKGLRAARKDFKGCSMMEFGSIGIDVKGIAIKVSKEYFKSLGMKHVSIDLDGRWGSLKLDLGKPLTQIKKKFDIVTNFGTGEHVHNQYECFKNMHNFCRVGGVMVHSVPMPRNWIGHCEFHYPVEFFTKLSALCGYEILDTLILSMPGGPPRTIGHRDLICVNLKKRSCAEFISLDVFKTLPISIEKYDKNHNNLRPKK